jgi:RNA polymerase sigma-70 factor (ECF subfamily)
MAAAAAPSTATMAPGTEEALELILRMAQGDRTALEGLYDRYAQLVFNVAVRILRNHADAEEVVQEVFWQAWRQAGRYEPARGAPWAWLVTLTRARAIDAFRARGPHRRRVELPLSLVATDPVVPPAEQLAEKQLVTGALDGLAATQRELLELAYYEGLTQTEIAARTGVPLGTVKTRLRAGLGRLRDSLLGKGSVVP